MNRRVLLLEPNYKNKYPPMGLMKLSTYFRNKKDDVRFFKGDLRNFAAGVLCEEFLQSVDKKEWGKYFQRLSEFIKTGKSSILESIPLLHNTHYEDYLKSYRRRFKTYDYPKFDFIGITTLFTFYWKQTIDTIN